MRHISRIIHRTKRLGLAFNHPGLNQAILNLELSLPIADWHVLEDANVYSSNMVQQLERTYIWDEKSGAMRDNLQLLAGAVEERPSAEFATAIDTVVTRFVYISDLFRRYSYLMPEGQRSE